jgi:hypothetical protein
MNACSACTWASRTAAALAAVLVLTASSPGVDAADPATRFGVVDVDEQKGLHLTVADDSLERGERIAIVRIPSGVFLCCAAVDRVLTLAEGEFDPVRFDGGAPNTIYALDPGGIGDEAGFGFGIIAAPPDLTSGELPQLDIDGDGVIERFSSCASSEGLHLTVSSGEPPKGVEIWHAYYYLGYDTEADCPPEEQ